MTRTTRLLLTAATLAVSLGLTPGNSSAHTATAKDNAPQLAGEWRDDKDQKAQITQTGDSIQIHFKHDFFNSPTVDKSDWVFTGTVDANGFELKHTPNHGNDNPGIPACAESVPEKYPLQLTGKLSADQNTIHATLSGETIAYDGCKLTKQEPRSLTFDLKCAIDEKVAGWHFEGECPSDPADGVKKIKVTPPGATAGTDVEIPGGDLLGYALPVKDKSHLFVPVVLPDLSVTAGGATITAYENTLGEDGVTIGTATLALPKYHTFALLQNLTIRPDLHVSADSLLINVYHASLEADTVDFTPGQGLSAKAVTIGLPDILGGGTVTVSDFGVDAQGAIRGTITGASFSIGDITGAFTDAKFTDTGFSLGSATLNMPAYIGGAVFEAKGVNYVAKDDSISVKEAGGGLHFNLGGKLLVNANVKLFLKDNGGFKLTGSGSVEIPDTPIPFFRLDAKLEIESIDCKPYPSRECPNPAFLHEATLSIQGKPVPLGQTGVAISGIGVGIKSDWQHPYLDANGDIQGVTYTFKGSVDLLTSADKGTIFNGTLTGTITTNGNFGLAIKHATALGFLNLHGGVCVRFVDLPGDTICDDAIPEAFRSQVVGTGIQVAGGLGAELHYEGWAGKVHASLGGDVYGRFVRVGDQSYIDAQVVGTMSASAHSWLLPDVEGSGTLKAELGRFNQPGGTTTLGIKGTLDATFKAHSTFKDTSFSIHRDVFIDEHGGYTEENVNAFTPVGPARRPSSARAGNEFTVGHGERQTFITASWLTGAPTFTLDGPNGLHAVVRSNGGNPTISATGPGAVDVYLVHVQVPRSLAIYLPAAAEGAWTLRSSGGGGVGVHVQGNKPRPTLTILAPAPGQTLHAGVSHVVQTIRGTLRGADPTATVTLYAGRNSCKSTSPGAAIYTGLVIAPQVKTGSGLWRYDWSTAGLEAGTYHVYAVLDNGRGPLVSACSSGTVSVERPPHPGAPHALSAQLRQQAVVVAWHAPDTAGTARGYVLRWRTGGKHPGAWHPLNAGNSQTRTLNVPPNANGYEVGVAGYDSAGRLGPYATVKAKGPAKPKKPQQHTGTTRTTAAAAPLRFLAAGSGCSAPSGTSTKLVTVPIFEVTDRTENIAYNDAAAISGKDPKDGSKARWVESGKYAPYPHKAAADLHYGRLSYTAGCVKLSKTNRAAACGKDPFKEGKSPGPPDGDKVNPKNGAQMNGDQTSCDEYPFASSREGGGTAIIRGVPLDENSQQGRDLAKFLRENANDLVLLDGEFQVCVTIKSKTYGDCASHKRKVKVP